MFNNDKKKKNDGGRINIYMRFEGKEGESIPTYRPGDDIIGVVNIDTSKLLTVNRVELELGWETEGKGDRDSEVLDRDLIDITELVPGEGVQHPFAFVAPRRPWSYSGMFIRLIWKLTVKVDVRNTLDLFNVGDAERDAPFILRP